MPAPSNTLLIEGSFEELCDELAQYIDGLNNAQGQQTSIQSEIAPLLQEDKKEDALKKVITASSVLNSAPEREFLAAYNLVIHLINISDNSEIFLPVICRNLAQPITSSQFNSVGLALNALSTIFNTLPANADSRYHVLLAILKIVRNSTATFEQLRPQLQNLESWLQSWDMDKEDQRKLYLAIADVANDSAEEEQGYQYLLTALRTLQDAEDASNEEAKDLSQRALRSALNSPTHFDFQDLTSLDSIQALRQSEATLFELLEIFNTENLDDFRDFVEGNAGYLEKNQLEEDVLERKMRLLTLASLAAGAGQTRTLPYSAIAKALQISSEDVEMWAIDGIRSGLVEGRLSQSDKSFLVHRATYRVFGDNQWKEVSSRLDMWKSSLQNVLKVVRAEKEQFIKDKENELRDAEQKENKLGYKPARVARNAPVEIGLD